MRMGLHLAVSVVVLVTALAAPAAGQVQFTVNKDGDASDANLADSVCDVDLGTPEKQCSLRAAIQESNQEPSDDVIRFNIPGTGARRIRLTKELPQVTDKVLIDGYTQPGSSPNSSPLGNTLNT